MNKLDRNKTDKTNLPPYRIFDQAKSNTTASAKDENSGWLRHCVEGAARKQYEEPKQYRGRKTEINDEDVEEIGMNCSLTYIFWLLSSC
jgi:hypothetical protein